MKMSDHMHHGQHTLLLSFLCISMVLIYIIAVLFSNNQYKPWPFSRIIYWIAGIFCIWYSVASPISNQNTFTQHMLCHLLLGMLTPLLLVLSAPMTLILRILKTPHARDLSHLLKCTPIRILAHPAVAAFFYIAGLILLYTTELYTLMHQYVLIYLLIHFHLLVAGYLFTASIIYIDPVPHRYSFLYRSTVCFLTLTVHAILSKYIYAHPSVNVPLEQAKSGAMIMYYGGDMIDAVLIYILCSQWFKATRNPARWRITLNSK